MTKFTVTTKTPKQIAAEFAAIFAGIEPDEAGKALTHQARLEPYRTAIMRQRRRGLTWQQIAEGMSRPPINEAVTWRLLQRVFGGANGGNKRPAKAGADAAPAEGPTTTATIQPPGPNSTDPAPATPAVQNAPARSGPRQPYVVGDPVTHEFMLMDPVTRKPIRKLDPSEFGRPGGGAA